jgi:hypothetical protein
MLQGLAGLAAPPDGRAGETEKWHKVAHFRAFFERPYTGEVVVVRGRDIRRPSTAVRNVPSCPPRSGP